MKKIVAIRGATCAENTKDSIAKNTVELCSLLFEKNSLSSGDIISVQFSLTRDLDEANPCTAMRNGNVGIDTSKIALWTSQEAFVKGGLEKVIRIMVTAYIDEKSEAHPVYINGAEILRPDFKVC